MFDFYLANVTTTPIMSTRISETTAEMDQSTVETTPTYFDPTTKGETLTRSTTEPITGNIETTPLMSTPMPKATAEMESSPKLTTDYTTTVHFDSTTGTQVITQQNVAGNFITICFGEKIVEYSIGIYEI